MRIVAIDFLVLEGIYVDVTSPLAVIDLYHLRHTVDRYAYPVEIFTIQYLDKLAIILWLKDKSFFISHEQQGTCPSAMLDLH